MGAPRADGVGRVYTFEGTTPGAVNATPKQTLLSPLPRGNFGLNLSR